MRYFPSFFSITNVQVNNLNCVINIIYVHISYWRFNIYVNYYAISEDLFIKI
jgi:hypothetical protein